MIIKLEKEERDLILLVIEKNDLREYRKSQKFIRDIKNGKYTGRIVEITKNNVYDIYDMILNFQNEMNFGDFNLIVLEEKFKRFINDIENNKMGWDNE